MSDNGSQNPSEPSKIDAAASDACTRSGTFALTLSVVLLLLVPYWQRVPTTQALADYVTYRMRIKDDLDRLDHNPYWITYSRSKNDLGSITLSSLPKRFAVLFDFHGHPESVAEETQPVPHQPDERGSALPGQESRSSFSVQAKKSDILRTDDYQHQENAGARSSANSNAMNLIGTNSNAIGAPPPPVIAGAVVAPPKTPPTSPEKTSTLEGSARKGKRNPLLPPPPTGLTGVVVTSMPVSQVAPEIDDLIATLKLLNDSKLLTQARHFSNYYAFSIGRWSQRTIGLVYKNAILGACTAAVVEKPYTKPPKDNFVPEIADDALTNCLTLDNLREIGAYEEPTMDNPDSIGASVGRPIEISLGALPRRVDQASIFADSLLIFVVIYFGAFTLEAAASPAFPCQGTLFGAFSGSRLTLLAMVGSLLTPLASSVAVAISAHKWQLWVESGIVAIVTASIVAKLVKRSYFSLLFTPPWKRDEPSIGAPEVIAEEDLPSGIS